MEKELRIAIGADHGGYDMKSHLIQYLNGKAFLVKDFGTSTNDSVDYPDFAHPISTAVRNGEYDCGILVCGTGNGMAITANKHEGIRAGLAWNEEVGALVKQHNNANVICLPGRFITNDMAINILEAYFNAQFEGDRHERRITKISC